MNESGIFHNKQNENTHQPGWNAYAEAVSDPSLLSHPTTSNCPDSKILCGFASIPVMTRVCRQGICVHIWVPSLLNFLGIWHKEETKDIIIDLIIS